MRSISGASTVGGARRVALVIALTAGLAACSSEETSTAPSASPSPTTVPARTTAPATVPAATTAPATIPPMTTPAPVPAPASSEPEIELPTGILLAVPTQNREDPAKNQFQVQIHNGTRERYDVIGVQFRWAGYTTPMTERDSIIVGGQIIDFPVPFPGASCAGDGGLADMPPVEGAVVALVLDDGSEVELPVYDQWHLARRLYLEDCERQMIEALVAIEWVDLHEEQFEGRPVTAGELRLTRRSGTGEIAILSVSNTIPYEFAAVDTGVGEVVAVLPDGVDEVSVPVRFLESRCDPHALAEVKQPTKFVAQVRLGDGSVHPYIAYPPREDWTPMRLTADAACIATGQVEFVGDE